MTDVDPEEQLLHSVALQDSASILLARRRAEEERGLAVEALRASEERLRAIFHQAAVGIAVAELDGRFVDMNQKFCDVLGYSFDELRQLSFRDLTHPDDLAVTQELVGRLLAGAIADYSLEKRYVRKDGGLVWSSTTVTVLKDATGLPTRFVGVVQDITERKHFEEALREESHSLELLNRIGVSLASKLDLSALVQTLTDAATEISGAEFGGFCFSTADRASEVPQWFALSGVPGGRLGPPARPLTFPLLKPVLRGEAPLRCDDVRLDPLHGPAWRDAPNWPLPLRSYMAVPVIGRAGDVIGGLFFGHSLPGAFSPRAERLCVGIAAQAAVAIDNARLYEAAQRAAAERMQLLESERSARSAAEKLSSLKDEFLATLSHELRTPLSAILGWTRVLRRAKHDAEDLRKGLETIERNALVQTRLIEDLLDMSRVTSGKLRLDLQQLDPLSFVEAAVESVRPTADAKGVRIETLVDAGAGPIGGDAGRLQQVVSNLLSNAVKFTPRDGRVHVLVQRLGASLEISVSDTGIGIKPEFLPLVFERFRQADASATRSHGGLGLGLSIVKHLVEMHGGSVRAMSAGEGLGATFSVELPLAPQASALRGGRLTLTGGSAGLLDSDAHQLSGMKVVAVDDDADARELLQRVLADCGATVFTAGSAEEALQLVESERPAVLVSDIGLPGADGFELLRRVRELGESRGGSVPAIALTAFARSEDRTRALRAGFRVHLTKPIEPLELVATVASVAGRTPAVH